MKKGARMPATTKRKQTSGRDFSFKRGMGILPYLKVSELPKSTKKVAGIDAEVHIFGAAVKNQKALESEIFKGAVDPWQQKHIEQGESDSLFIQSSRGPVWVARPRMVPKGSGSHYGLMDVSSYASMRDRVGALWQSLKDLRGPKHLGIFFHGCSDEEIHGALVGLEIAAYRFTQLAKQKPLTPGFKITAFGVTKDQIAAATRLGEGVNLARHLVNLDASRLNPKSYADFMKSWFKGVPGVTVDIWTPERLRKENMNLHYGVGQGAAHKSHMVHIKYRPRGKSRLKKPLAFVGKGVTFDTGGLDIKPASGMRLMKKDMGGSASIAGIAHWATAAKVDIQMDFYLALAENAVDQHSFKPGDVITARNGLSVEIHNTDAEGRLVMADVLDVATNLPPERAPMAVIDLSTLTGAMRVAVGAEIAGMFSNHDKLADLALTCGATQGDPAWRMPLWDGYKTHLRSSFADMANASDSGFGGAISAALFLQKFVKAPTPWLHFDLYCWTDKVSGALGDIGGNGQGVQLFAAFLSKIDNGTFA
jgi:leucyl aminopeptidase